MNDTELFNLPYKDVIKRLNDNELSTKEIKALLKHYTKISQYCAGVRDIVFIYKLEDFLSHLRRQNHDLLN
jgi:DNA-binding transcriptional MerR regulator